MGFSSLADELGDVFERDDQVQGGRSLADEFGLDFGLEDELAADGSLDEVDDSLGASPQPPNPLTPLLPPSTPTPSSRSPGKKDASPLVYQSSEDLMEDSPFYTSINLPRSPSPSTPPRHRPLVTPHQQLSPLVRSTTSRFTPVIERDPIVELEECIASTSRLIGGLKALHPPPPPAGLSTSVTVTSLSSRSISSFGSHTTLKAINTGGGGQGDVLDRLAAYAVGMQKREKRLDERMKELEGMMGRWEDVGFGAGLELDLEVVKEGLREEVFRPEGLPQSRSSDLPSLSSLDHILSPSQDIHDPFSPPPKIQHSPLNPLDASSNRMSQMLAEIYPDPLLPTLLSLRETLHTHSSHTLATQRQVRQVQGAIQGARERDEAEETARKGIEAWEEGRVADGLKGEGGVGVRLGREVRGFEEVMGGLERNLEVRMGNVRALRAC